IVNNNLYTNMMAQQNLILAKNLIRLMKEKYPSEWERLKNKVSFSEEEISKWDDIIENITICYNVELDLYEEDDMYLSRVPLDMNKAKPTAKRIIDSTIPYEALMLYQVTKQADVLHLMKNLHWRFTHQQKVNAWKYYVPKTCFDSSLAFSIHAVMAAQIDLQEEAYNYFKVCANFDIRNVLLNTVSGLHFANFGGTWQAVVFGFAGLQVDEYHLKISPNLPRAWKSISFHIWYRGNLLKIYFSQESTEVYLKHANGKDICLKVSDTEFILNESNNHIKLSINGDE
ncbi:MAG: glycoside hydrolase family 65 protein, partial [Clostridiaceae bacterium]|nr:glycoside hydrolase family 65 protein [Clostridiaceae bacterium]